MKRRWNRKARRDHIGVGLGGLALLALILACDASPRAVPDKPNVLLLTVDTLRADRLGVYGYRLDTTPNIDRLAMQGALFEDCTVQWPKTWPSIASLMTGAYPKTTGMQYVRRALPSSFHVLSEILRDAGYTTAAVVANYNIGKIFGFDQGFDDFIESWQDKWAEEAKGQPFTNTPELVKRYTNATIVTDQGISLLREREKKRPFFLWLHYMDPHGPYVPPESFRNTFEGEHTEQPSPLGLLPKYQRQTDPETGKLITNLGFYQAQYDGEIRYLDEEIGRFLAELDAMNLSGSTVIVLTADHGESLGEHDYYFDHGKFSYQVTARIPLMIVNQGVIEAGRRIKQPIGLIDLPPTILELAGIEAPVTFEGESLLSLLRGAGNGRRSEHVFMESGYYPEATQLTVRHAEWKLIHVQARQDRRLMAGTEFELYNVYEDPYETKNLVSRHPDVVEDLKRVLSDWYAGGSPLGEKGEEIDIESLDPKSIEMLKSLGYIQ